MPTIELNLSPEYVPHWGFLEAIRELFQNALDEQVGNPKNDLFWDYDPDKSVLKVGNTLSGISRQTLMIGNTSKTGKTREIGKYGEGYKLALLVLARGHFPVKIRNYANRELWTPLFVKSKNFGCDVLAVSIKKFLFKSTPDRNLVFEIGGVTEDLMESLRYKNLTIWPYTGEKIETHQGDILLHPDYSGRIYISGLFVCKNKDLKKGYDFKPAALKLDRERRLVSDFDLNWATSNMWAITGSGYQESVVDMMLEDVKDTRFVDALLPAQSLKDLAYERFSQEHGASSYPVSTQEESDRISRLGLCPVIVPAQYRDLVISSGQLREPEVIRQTISPYGQLFDFAQKHKSILPLEVRKDLARLLLNSKKWELS